MKHLLSLLFLVVALLAQGQQNSATAPWLPIECRPLTASVKSYATQFFLCTVDTESKQQLEMRIAFVPLKNGSASILFYFKDNGSPLYNQLLEFSKDVANASLDFHDFDITLKHPKGDIWTSSSLIGNASKFLIGKFWDDYDETEYLRIEFPLQVAISQKHKSLKNHTKDFLKQLKNEYTSALCLNLDFQEIRIPLLFLLNDIIQELEKSSKS